MSAAGFSVRLSDAQVHVILDALAVHKEDIESNGSDPWSDYAELPDGAGGAGYVEVLNSCRGLLLALITPESRV